MNRNGNSVAKIVVILAAVLLVVFGITKRVAAPSEGELPMNGAEETVEEGGVQPPPPPPTPPTASCGQKNSVCETSDDCCGNMGLECQEVRTSDGGRAKRCLPVEVMICRSDCESGTWAEPRGCRTAVAPSDMVRCESFVGSDCKASTNEHRNTRECTDT